MLVYFFLDVAISRNELGISSGSIPIGHGSGVEHVEPVQPTSHRHFPLKQILFRLHSCSHSLPRWQAAPYLLFERVSFNDDVAE